MEQQPTSTDMFVESVRRLPAVDAAANAMWGSNVLLREDLERRRKQPKWDLRWLWVFPQLPVETLEGLAQAILVYKSPDAAAPLQVHPVYSALVEVHRKFQPAMRPPRFVFEVDSRGEFAAPRWQLTFAVESAEAVEGWSQYWSEVSDGLSSARSRHRAHHSIEGRLAEAEPVRLQGIIELRLTQGRKYKPTWCVVRGPLMQFYASEADAKQAERDGQVLTHRGGVNRGKGMEAQEATVHLEHAIISDGSGKPGREFEIVSGSKSWKLRTTSEEQNTMWTTMLRSLANGDSAATGMNQHNGHTAAVPQVGVLADAVTIRAEIGQRQLGLNFARCFAERLGAEYFSVQSIRRPDTVAAAAEPELKLGMVLQSINGVAFMQILAECGGRGDLAFDSLQQRLTQRPLTLKFVRTPDALREDMDAATATMASAQTASATVVVTPGHGGNERRLISGKSAVSTSGSNVNRAVSHRGVAAASSGASRRVSFASGTQSNGGGVSSMAGAAAVGQWKRNVHDTRNPAITSARRTSIGSSVGGTSVASTSLQTASLFSSQPGRSHSSPSTLDTTPIARARAHYGPWWSRMSKHEQQLAVAAAEQEMALVDMGVINPHHFDFHTADGKLEADAAEEAARAAQIAELVQPSGNPWAIPPSQHPIAAAMQEIPTQPEPEPEPPSIASLALSGSVVHPGGILAISDLTPATREFMQGVADAKRMSVSKNITDVHGAPIAPPGNNSGPFTDGGGHAEFLQGVRDAREQAEALAKQSPGSPAERWATRPTHALAAPPMVATSVSRTAAALALTASGAEYDL